MTSSTTRVAIVGAGPAGFFAVEALLKSGDPVAIDLINRLPAPYGLVRDGVAPDHQAIKSVARVYSRILARDEVRYFGNVTLGEDISVGDLRARYDQIVYAVGAQSDRRLGIPGEDLEGSHAAFHFVAWYNGHPDFRDAQFDLGREDVVVIGNGNVAIDVARILVLSLDRLAATDIADHALAGLRNSQVRRVTMLGRRGPAQASFTNPELREFGRLDGVSAVVDGRELELDAASEAAIEGDAVKTRQHGHAARLRGVAAPGRRPGGAVPVPGLAARGGRRGGAGRRGADREEPPGGPGGRLHARRGHGRDRDLAVRDGDPLGGVPGRAGPGSAVRRAAAGSVPNEGGAWWGRGACEGAARRAGVVPGEYVVGWAKRGPSGVIGTNKADAAATVALMREDLAGGGARGGAGLRRGPPGSGRPAP